jgi:hypothetical protein
MRDDTPDWVMAEIGDPNEFFLGLLKERTFERKSSIQDVIDKYGISFRVNEQEERCYFTADYNTHEITVGIRSAARLMAHSFAYTSIHYGFLRKIQEAKKGRPVPVDYDKCIANASHILQWAVTGDIESRGVLPERVGIAACLPADVVGAFEASVPRDKQDIADIIYANALVWILFHEISHIELEHRSCKGFDSIEQEREADHNAAMWMLGCDSIDSKELWQRRIGVATALGWLTAPNVYLGTPTSNTHPAAYNRLYQVLDRSLPDDEEDTWLFVQVILMLHLMNRGIEFDDDCFVPDFKSNVNYLIDIVANVGKR